VGANAGWEETRLWIELEGRGDKQAKQLQVILAEVLPDAEEILDSGSSPQNFTLHDADHAFRVAERIVDLLEAEPALLKKVGPYDLALLLLAAYLHDIGMSPSLSRIQDHYDFLLTGEGNLNLDEQNELQMWLDDEWDGQTPPLARAASTPHDLHLAQQMIAGYIRHRHNDWSAEWIETKVEPFASKGYPGWVEDVVLLCQSHHFSIDQLKSPPFDPRLVGNPGTVLHLRYCACVLRIADVLDFDPERTPQVLFAHRDIGEESAIYWHKDHELAFDQAKSVISIHAQPSNALTHYAINLTVDDVDRELLGSRRLADETQFHRMAGREDDLPHRWRLETSVRAKVVPREGTYEYIDGTFRPDPSRLLELVGGVELYGSPLAAVRELLQNAFDAVRDQIARQRLRQDDPSSEEVAELLARTHSVSLVLEQSEEGVRLTCRDTGSGMSREIIKSRFLVGGRKANHEMRALERLCRDKGFSTGKTARFGIGVLSYFLIASDLKIRTQRSIEAHNPDGTGWTFTIAGLSDFGELKRAPAAQVGTEVSLTIRPDLLVDGVEAFVDQVRDYLQSTVRRIPCRFSFSAPGFSVDPFVNDLGWIDREEEVREQIIESMLEDTPQREVPEELLSVQAREDRGERSEYRQAIRAEISKCLKLEERQGSLPDDLGTWRSYLCRFDFEGDLLPAFFKLDGKGEHGFKLKPLGLSTGLSFPGTLMVAWNGMDIDLDVTQRTGPLGVQSGCFLEIDWCDDGAGRLAVSRNCFEPDQVAVEATKEVAGNLFEDDVDLVSDLEDSPFYLLSVRCVGTSISAAGLKRWPEGAEFEGGELRQLDPPLINDIGGFRELLPPLRWRGLAVTSIYPRSAGTTGMYRDKFSWYGEDIAPGSVAAYLWQDRLKIVPVWDDLDRVSQPPHSPPGFKAEFPPGWTCLTGVSSYSSARIDLLNVWNQDHPLIRSCSPEAWEWIMGADLQTADPLDFRSELLEEPSRAAAWMIHSLMRSSHLVWEGLIDREPSFLRELWAAVNGLDEIEKISFWRSQSSESGELIVATPSTWSVHYRREGYEKLREHLPLPGEEWQLLAAEDPATTSAGDGDQS